MAAFPSGLASFAGFIASHTLAVDSHAAQHNLEQAEILATQTKIGTGSSTPTSGKLLRGNGVGTSVWAQADLTSDVSGVLPQANGGTGTTLATGTGKAVYGTSPTISNPTITGATLAGVSSVLSLIYPIGCIYTETTGVSPATTFGFGTWAAFGAGRVLIGNGTSDQAFAAGATGGESNHLLTGGESGTSVHGHGVTDPTHTHNYSTTRGGLALTGGGSATLLDPSLGNNNVTLASSTGLTVNNSSAANASNAHNNLQPYLVVYFWQRTA